jgi:thymidylate kinase
MNLVIVAVEGPSAAGKTTWCRQHTSVFVEEYAPTGAEPDGSDVAAQAAYWVAINSGRWRAAAGARGASGDGDL